MQEIVGRTERDILWGGWYTSGKCRDANIKCPENREYSNRKQNREGHAMGKLVYFRKVQRCQHKCPENREDSNRKYGGFQNYMQL